MGSTNTADLLDKINKLEQKLEIANEKLEQFQNKVPVRHKIKEMLSEVVDSNPYR